MHEHHGHSPEDHHDAHEHDHHNHVAHEHEPDHPHEKPVISRRWQWATALGNAAIGACELLTGNLNTLSVASDGVHNLGGDAATYYIQAENIINPNLTQERRDRLRKIAHWLIAATSLGVSAKAGMDFAVDHESAPHPAAIYTAGASLALNGLMLASLRRGIRRKHGGKKTVYEKDLAKHFWAVDIPSAGLAVTGAALQKYNVDIEQTAAVVSGLLGAYFFRPTKANLAHDHSHTGEDHHHGHGHEHSPEAPGKKSWLARMAYRPRHEHRREPSRVRTAIGLGATALALMGGLLSGDTNSRANATAEQPRGQAAATAQPNIPAPPPAEVKTPSITECVTIQPGDSQWKIVERRIKESTGERPTIAATNTITMLTAIKNKANAPDPSTIRPGECLHVPTASATQILHRAATNHLTDPSFTADVLIFSRQANMHDVLQQTQAAERINLHLQKAMAS